MNNSLSQIIRMAGGPSAVARQFGLTPQAIINWIKRNQLPKNFWTGAYDAKIIIDMCKQNGFEIMKDELLAVPLRQSQKYQPLETQECK